MLIGKTFSPGGYFYYGWVIPAMIILVVFAVAYIKFLFSLRSNTRNLFILSALVYITGGLGIEMVSAKYFTIYGDENMVYAMITTMEESLELIGILIFQYALMKYLSYYKSKFEVVFGNEVSL